MKRIVSVILLVLCCAFVMEAQQDKSTRVRFQKGRTTAILTGRLERDSIRRYVLSARAGQTLIAHVTSPKGGVQFDVFLRSDRDALEGAEDVKDFEGTLPRSGDYVISVYETKGRSPFTLEVTIR